MNVIGFDKSVINNNRYNSMNNQPLTFIEVCAGAGGLSSGLIHAGLTPVLLNDNNKDCCATLRMNHPGVPVICAPMNELDLTPFIDRVDLLAGGVPCQSFSQAGCRRGLEDPRGELMNQFANMVHTIHPKIFMIENVRGLMTHNGGHTLTEVINLMDPDKLYHIVYRLLNATDYDVPQKRERIFLVGVRKDCNITFRFPDPTGNSPVLGDVLTNVPHSIGAEYPAEKQALFAQIPPGGCWVNLPEEQQRAYMGASFASGGGKRGILRRLAMDAPSLTLLCTPSQKQTERCHPTEIRPLNVREYARIQTFPDDYQFHGGMSSQYKQIGNAVPVRMAFHMGLKLRTALMGE